MNLKFKKGLPVESSAKAGFTLIELLIVIAIIAILAGVVFVSLDPGQRFQDARDASRWTDVTAILSAIKVDQVDNRGAYLAEISGATAGTNYIIGTNASGCNYTAETATDVPGCKVTTNSACKNLADTGADGLVKEGYLGKMPVNVTGQGPSAGNSWDDAKTGYYFRRNANGSISVGSCDTESPSLIEVTR